MRQLLPSVELEPLEIAEAWERIVRELGWDGRGNRFRMDQLYAPFEREVDYRLRERSMPPGEG